MGAIKMFQVRETIKIYSEISAEKNLIYLKSS